LLLLNSHADILQCFSPPLALQLVAVYEEQEVHPAGEVANGGLPDRQSPDTFESELAAQLAAFQPITGEIEVTSSALKGSE